MKPATPILAATVLAGMLAFHDAEAQQKRSSMQNRSPEQSRFYLGASLGQSTFREFCSGGPTVLSCDDTDTAWKLFGGYRFNRYVALEGTYVDWGEVSGILADPTPRVVPLRQTATGVAVVGSIPLGPEFSLFGKLGYLWVEQERPASASGSFERKEEEAHFGAGARFAFTPNWVARLEWERTSEDTKVHTLSIGLEYRF